MENASNDIKLAIIDIDGMFFQSSTDTIEESIQKFKDKFNNLLEKTQCTHYVGFYSKGKYFRHNIDPEYKITRGKYAPPKWLKALKNWAITEYGFQYMDNVEADDLACYWINNPIYYGKFTNPHSDTHMIFYDTLLWKSADEAIKIDPILCTPDKDLLQSIPGKHFNYSYKITDEAKEAKKLDENYEIKDEEVIKGWWVETNIAEAAKFKALQLLMGDSGDSIKGLDGIGPKKAEKILDKFDVGIDLYTFLFDQYRAFYKDNYSKAIFEFQKNYRLLHMLENDEDFMREVGKLPEFPIITEVKKESNNIEF